MNLPIRTTWNLELLYSGHDDPQIEADVRAVERAYSAFDKKYRGRIDYLEDEDKLLDALTDFELIFTKLPLTKPLSYFDYCRDLDSRDSIARAKATALFERFAKNEHKIVFFELALAKVPEEQQKEFLKSKKLAHFRYYLKMHFERAKHDLSEAEEGILGLMRIPAYKQWIMSTEKLLNKQTVDFQGMRIPVSEALQRIHDMPISLRRELHEKTMGVLESISDAAESEVNAIITDKKITDELRGYSEPYDQTILRYQNDRRSVMALVDAVTKNFHISHRFFELKAKILGLSKLEYSDRAIGIGENVKEISFDEAVAILRDVFGSADTRYLEIFDSYLENGQIDVYPRVGKTGGAYCSHNLNAPTFILLNYTKTMDQVMTLAHEMGHAIHTELSKSRAAIYQNYSFATAEVASTLFESFAFDAMFEKLSKEEKIIALHKRINDDIQLIFRQIACFNFEVDLHALIRARGELSKEDIRALLNKHMGAYMGPIAEMKDVDGNFFVCWGHIRKFFYVYTYAFGQLVSKALYVKYKEDKSYIKKINTFLSAGGSDSPENIFKSIGIDVTTEDFWQNGLWAIDKDIDKLERLIKNKNVPAKPRKRAPKKPPAAKSS